jgi:hypothetical protein
MQPETGCFRAERSLGFICGADRSKSAAMLQLPVLEACSEGMPCTLLYHRRECKNKKKHKSQHIEFHKILGLSQYCEMHLSLCCVVLLFRHPGSNGTYSGLGEATVSSKIFNPPKTYQQTPPLQLITNTSQENLVRIITPSPRKAHQRTIENHPYDISGPSLPPNSHHNAHLHHRPQSGSTPTTNHTKTRRIRLRLGLGRRRRRPGRRCLHVRTSQPRTAQQQA